MKDIFNGTSSDSSFGGNNAPEYVMWTYAFIISVTALLSICLNITHFRVVRSYQELTLASRIFFKTHAIFDILLAGSYGLAVPLIVGSTWDVRNLYCCISGAFLSLTSVCTVSLYAHQNLDRLLSVAIPYRYAAIVTEFRIWVWTISTPLLASGMIILSIVTEYISNLSQSFARTYAGLCVLRQVTVIQSQKGFITFLLSLLVPYIILIFVYTWLLVVTYRHAQKINAQEMAGAPRLNNNQGVLAKVRSLKRALFTVLVTAGWYVLTVIPIGVWQLLYIRLGGTHFSVSMFAFWIFLCNTCGNFLSLYVLKESYRVAMKSELRNLMISFSCKNRPNDV